MSVESTCLITRKEVIPGILDLTEPGVPLVGYPDIQDIQDIVDIHMEPSLLMLGQVGDIQEEVSDILDIADIQDRNILVHQNIHNLPYYIENSSCT